MKKTAVLILAICASATLCARPGPAFGPRHPVRPPMRPPVHVSPHHHHHHHSNGGALAAGLVGGAILGGIVASTVTPAPVVVHQPVVVQPAPVVVQPAPVVVQQPVYQTQNVWVEGRYVDTVQPNGAVIRTWQPGHYEQRTVRIQ